MPTPMKLLHMTALALASWYLLIPMFDPRTGKMASLPLSEWNQEGIFETAAECARAKRSLIDEYRKHGAPPRVLDVLTSQAQCIASDDARLNGKVPYGLAPLPQR